MHAGVHVGVHMGVHMGGTRAEEADESGRRKKAGEMVRNWGCVAVPAEHVIGGDKYMNSVL